MTSTTAPDGAQNPTPSEPPAPPRLILASASPRRQAILRDAGYDFLVHPAAAPHCPQFGRAPSSHRKSPITPKPMNGRARPAATKPRPPPPSPPASPAATATSLAFPCPPPANSSPKPESNPNPTLPNR